MIDGLIIGQLLSDCLSNTEGESIANTHKNKMQGHLSLQTKDEAHYTNNHKSSSNHSLHSSNI